MPAASVDPRSVLGRSPDVLSLQEHMALAGKYIAMEVYTPETLPLRSIEAIGDSMEACVKMLMERGLNASQFEITRLYWPY